MKLVRCYDGTMQPVRRPDYIPPVVADEFAESVVFIQERNARARSAGHIPAPENGPPPYWNSANGRYEYPPAIRFTEEEMLGREAVAREYFGAPMPQPRPDQRFCHVCKGLGQVQDADPIAESSGHPETCPRCYGAGIL